jgi:hypothetical protein
MLKSSCFVVTAQIIRAILFASASAATIFGLRATSAASQRFELPPLRTARRITLIAPTIRSPHCARSASRPASPPNHQSYQ